MDISRREVINNLIRFKESLSGVDQQQVGKLAQRVYTVLLNRRTGDMRFAQTIKSLESRISSYRKADQAGDWKEIRIIVKQDSLTNPAHFEVENIKSTDLEPLAWKVASETLEVLNSRAEAIKGTQGKMLAEEAVLNDLSSIQIEIPNEQIKNLAGWRGSINRVDAEKELMDQAIGTYLLREGDDLTVAISFHFAQQNRLQVHPFLLTVVEEDQKIVDILLLQTNKGWVLYHDDPNLKDPTLYQYHDTPQALINTIQQIARRPVA